MTLSNYTYLPKWNKPTAPLLALGPAPALDSKTDPSMNRGASSSPCGSSSFNDNAISTTGSSSTSSAHAHHDLMFLHLPDIEHKDIMAAAAAHEAFATPPSTESTLTTPLLNDNGTSGHGGHGHVTVDSHDFDLNALLSQPMYDEPHGDVGNHGADKTAFDWNPLFPTLSREAVAAASASVKRELPNDDARGSTKRAKSSSASASASASPPSSTLAVSKADPKASRRARNTIAARKSRERKRERMQDLEDRVAELEMLNTKLEIENQFLRDLKQLPPRT